MTHEARRPPGGRPDNKVQLRSLTVEPASDQWRVVAGLQAGERVIVQGQQGQSGRAGQARDVKLDTPAHG